MKTHRRGKAEKSPVQHVSQLIVTLMFAMLLVYLPTKTIAMTHSNNTLIPAPSTITLGDGFFHFNSQTALVANTDVLAVLPQEVREWLLVKHGLLLRQSQHDAVSDNMIAVAIDQSMAAEAYSIRVNESGAYIKASTAAGFYYAYQSLRQLSVNSSEQTVAVPFLSLTDQPRYRWRGMMLDVSRHFYDVEFIKRYLDLLALHKMNVFHWHLTDDQGWRIEIKAYPKLTSIGGFRDQTVVGHTSDRNPHYDGIPHGGFYTQQQIRDVVAYAEQKNIMVVPEIDLPGHTSALLEAYPEFGCLKKDYKVQTRFGIFVDVLCPTEATMAMVDTIVEEVAGLFPGEYLHIGGDEVKTDHWRDCPACQQLMQDEKLANLRQIQGYFVKRIAITAAKYDKKIIGWDEVLEGDVDRSTTIMSWQGMAGGITAAKAGHDVIMTPVSHVYFDFYQSTSLDTPQAIHGYTPLSKVYQFDLTPAELTDEEASFILGGQGNVWTEYLPTEEAVELAVLPRMTALAEAMWSQAENKSWDDFSRRLPRFLQRLENRKYHISQARFKPAASMQANMDGTITLSLSIDSPHHDIYYWTDDSGFKRYQQPITVSEKTTLHATGVDKNARHPEEAKHYGHEIITVEPHKAMLKPVSYLHNPEVTGNPLEGQLLVNGMLSTDRIFQYHEWGGFDSKGMDAVIDLGQSTLISTARLGFDAGSHRRLYKPTNIEILISDDQQQWQSIAVLDQAEIDALDKVATLSWDALKTRYIRVRAENDNIDFSAEDKREIPMTIHIDEIVVH
ncbi:hypothetical protein SIN8267_01026 [Sinobacterium norvegicum]|uniref:beta-N-acetylhexosaminidase n=1 Tax=Sinobacterium norvegicum TaxID=1641715 RepID=A0ABM9ACM0_9GAMM|nr:family 20 glycosylhydrolase [Sinobacterium norvegicum]CAH0990925.1 hypothetical protein SIN8267_01026 [Sinobacterium norvegicum]